ncbi:MAG: Fe2+-dependent dioxygenase [Comamonadaceae bacterium]|nr:MAG: Fe2+-dependent dioxygenase [Comamonadaceae bacterium]
MILHLKEVLSPEDVLRARSLLGETAPWIDGRTSAGGQAVTKKQNLQLAQNSDQSRQLQALVLTAVQKDPVFFSAALPKKIFNPLFNQYSGDSNFYGNHVDGAVLKSQSTQQWVRTDISCTLFLTDPADYDGGELVFQESQGERRVKLPAGDLIMYPGTTLHQVTPVTRGKRIASFFWIESMVRSQEQRQLLFDMDMALVRLRSKHDKTDQPGDAALTQLTGTYHNLLRLWADT